MADNNVIVIDTETTAIKKNHVEGCRLVLIGHYENGVYTPIIVDHVQQMSDNAATLFKSYQEWAKTYAGLIVGHNLLFDLCVLRTHGVEFPNARFWDTQLALKKINENETTLRLKTWATWLGFPPYADEFQEWMAKGISTIMMPLEMVTKYNEQDCIVTEALYQWQQQRMKQHGVFEFEMSMLPIVEKMANGGVGLDIGKLKDLTKETWEQMAAVDEKIIKKYGPINLNSPKQVSALLFDRLGLKEQRGRSVDKKAIKKLRHPIIEQLQTRNKLETLLSKFLVPYEQMRVGDRLFGSWRMHGTESARMTCKEPPLQTAPVVIRPCFKPKNGKFLWLDLEQIEYKLLASLAGETKLIEAINRGEDVHKATAALLFGIPYDQVTDAQRKVAKTTNYAKIYGAGCAQLAETAEISFEKAKEFSMDYDYMFRKIYHFMEAVEWQVLKTGCIESPFGRVRTFPTDVENMPYEVRSAIKRQAVDFIFQSMGHDILWILWRHIAWKFPELEAVLEYHDEIVWDIAPEDEERYLAGIQVVLDKLNQTVYNIVSVEFAVPLTATVHTGFVWE